MAEAQSPSATKENPVSGSDAHAGAAFAAERVPDTAATGESAPDAAAQGGDKDDNLEEVLDEEAAALLAELEESERELRRVIDAQTAQTTALDLIKTDLTKQVKDLSEEAWRLQEFCELEDMKKQLVTKLAQDGEQGVMPGGQAPALMQQLLALERQLDSANIGESSREAEAESAQEGAAASASADSEANPTTLAELMAAARVSGSTADEVRELVEEDAALDAQLGSMQAQLDTARAAAQEFLAKQRALESQLNELMSLAEEGPGSAAALEEELDKLDTLDDVPDPGTPDPTET